MVYQQTRRWLDAGVFTDMVHGLRELPRWAAGRAAESTTVMVDAATR